MMYNSTLSLSKDFFLNVIKKHFKIYIFDLLVSPILSLLMMCLILSVC